MVLAFIVMCNAASLGTDNIRCDDDYAIFESVEICKQKNNELEELLKKKGVVVLSSGCYALGEPV